MIYHITSKDEWARAQQRGEYSAPSLQAEGFIHLSTDRQVLQVANAFYAGRADLLLLFVDETKLESELKWEPPAGPPAAGISAAELFPHLYGPINLTAVASAPDLKLDSATGTFTTLPH